MRAACLLAVSLMACAPGNNTSDIDHSTRNYIYSQCSAAGGGCVRDGLNWDAVRGICQKDYARNDHLMNCLYGSIDCDGEWYENDWCRQGYYFLHEDLTMKDYESYVSDARSHIRRCTHSQPPEVIDDMSKWFVNYELCGY